MKTPKTTTNKKRRIIRRLGCAGAILLVLALPVFVVVVTGFPLAWLASRVGSSAVGARVVVENVSMHGLSRVGAHRVAVYDSNARSDEKPVIEIEGLELDYSVFPQKESGQSYLTTVIAESLRADVFYAGRDNTNLGFLFDLLDRPQKEAGTTSFMPGGYRIDTIDLTYRSPSATWALEGLELSGYSMLAPIEGHQFTLHGDPVMVQSMTPFFDAPIVAEDGVIDIEIEKTGPDLQLPRAVIKLPGLANIEATATYVVEHDESRLSISSTAFEVQGAWLAGLSDLLLGLPVKFEMLHASDLAIENLVFGENWSVDRVNVAAKFDGLVVGLADAPYYQGNLAVNANGNEHEGNLLFTLNESQDLAIDLRAEPLLIHATIDGWTGEQVRAALPHATRNDAPALLDITALTASATMKQIESAFEVNLDLKPTFSDKGMVAGPAAIHINGTVARDPAAPLSFDLDANGSVRGVPLVVSGQVRAASRSQPLPLRIEGEAAPADGSGKMDFAANLASTANFQIDLRPNHLESDRIMQLLALDPLPMEMTGPITGNVALAGGEGNSATFQLESDAWKMLDMNDGIPLVASGKIQLDAERKRIRDGRIAFQTPEEQALTLTDMKYSIAEQAGSAKIAGAFELELIQAMFALDNLSGSAHIEAATTLSPGRIKLDTNATLSNLIFDRFAYLAGDIDLAGAIDIETASGNATLTNVNVQIGEGAVLESAKVEYNGADKLMSGPITLSSDLVVATDMGFLEAVDGGGTGSGTFSVGPAGFSTRLRFDVTADSLALPGKVAVFTDCTAEGTAGYDGGMTGRFDMVSAGVLVFGALIKDVVGPVMLENTRIIANDIKAHLFGGIAQFDIEIGLLEEGRPIEVTGNVMNLDLDVFTTEYKPPGVTMTGLADGSFAATLNADGIQSLRGYLKCDRNFTINRNAVQQMLFSQYVMDLRGGKKLDKIVKKVVGDDPQRPFASAELDLRMEEGSPKGAVRLASDALNLTINLNADPGALEEAMRLRQNEQLENIANVDVEALQ